jgi:hypothetical protein
MKKTTTKQDETKGKADGVLGLQIAPPNMKKALFTIRGTTPYVQARFSGRVIAQMIADQSAGKTAKSKKTRTPKDFDALTREALHVSDAGWVGLPATAFRAAMISACRTVGFRMTLAKLSVFVDPDGFDKVDGTPLVKITKGDWYRVDHAVRNATGVVDIRPRPMWDPGWEAIVTVRWDADQFTLRDVLNLMSRVGLQVGIGEGRPDSRQSCGQGWGLFEVAKVEAEVDSKEAAA